MKYRHGSLFLAVALFAAAPAFADKIPADIRDADKGSVYMRALPNAKGLPGASVCRNSNLRTFKEEEFPGEFGPVVLMGDLTKDSKIADLDILLNSGLGSNGHQVNLFDIRFNHAEFWGRGGGRDWDHHNWWERDGNDGALCAVATPEPGSRTLLLFGLAGLAIIAYRRNVVKSPI